MKDKKAQLERKFFYFIVALAMFFLFFILSSGFGQRIWTMIANIFGKMGGP